MNNTNTPTAIAPEGVEPTQDRVPTNGGEPTRGRVPPEGGEPTRDREAQIMDAEASPVANRLRKSAVELRAPIEVQYCWEQLGEQTVSKLLLRRGMPVVKIVVAINAQDTHDAINNKTADCFSSLLEKFAHCGILIKVTDSP